MKLKKYLTDRRIRQVELAKALGVDPSVVNLFVNGWRPVRDVYREKICAFLGISSREFSRLIERREGNHAE